MLAISTLRAATEPLSSPALGVTTGILAASRSRWFVNLRFVRVCFVSFAHVCSCFGAAQALTRAAIPQDKDFLLTEYNAGCCMQYFQHDNSGAAAFAFRSVGELSGITDVLSFWSFTDIFEEGNQIDLNDEKKLPEFGDIYGLMTYHGVPKPGWRAFALLHAASTQATRQSLVI